MEHKSSSTGHKYLVIAGLIITGLIAVASIALIIWDPWAPKAPSGATSAPPSAETALGKLHWHDTPVAVPATTFISSDAPALTLGNFAGRVLVVNFWATWCEPCIREMPTLDALQAELGGDGFAVVAINQDRGGLDVARKFFAEHGWKNLTIYADTALAFAKDAKLRGLPTSLVVDREGREVARLEGTIAWNSPEVVAMLRKLMAESQPSAKDPR
jgi:thiol-disulfide isomerase/thioredoxin